MRPTIFITLGGSVVLTGCFGALPILDLSNIGNASTSDSESTSNQEPGGTSTGHESSTSGAAGTTEMEAVATSTGTDANASTLSETSTESGEESSTENSTGSVALCHDGRVEEGEDCDGIDWQGATCESLGYAPGRLICTDECLFDATGCVPPGMVLIAGGPFEMGSTRRPDEQPIRNVDLDPFYIDIFEVTVAEYAECVNSGHCGAPELEAACNFGIAGRENHPVNCVDWARASTYCHWAASGEKRLPTEAEWEKAARGTDARSYPWGDAPEPSCTHIVMNESGAGCGAGSTWSVGSRAAGASPHGTMDMAGNVWEWVDDWYGDYDPAATDNPKGPVTGTDRVLRGGGWYYGTSEYFSTTYRHHTSATEDDQFVGFRCARSLPGAWPPA